MSIIAGDQRSALRPGQLHLFATIAFPGWLGRVVGSRPIIMGFISRDERGSSMFASIWHGYCSLLIVIALIVIALLAAIARWWRRGLITAGLRVGGQGPERRFLGR